MEMWTLIIVTLVALLEATSAQASCVIPTGEQYGRAKYGLVFSAKRRQFPGAAFDGNWKFKPGIAVPDLVKVRVQCTKDTYGDAIHNLHTSTCRNGAWFPALPDCQVQEKRCGMLPYVRTAYASERRRAHLTFASGHVVSFRCRHGRLLVGNNEIVCHDGRWSQLEFRCNKGTISQPKRSPRSCPPLQVDGARISGSGHGIASNTHHMNGSSVRFECIPGLKLTGNNEVVCTDGRWSEVMFKCEKGVADKKGCKPLEVDGAMRTDVSKQNDTSLVPSGSYARFKCMPGRMLSGSSVVDCYDGAWSEIKFTCSKKASSLKGSRSCPGVRIRGARADRRRRKFKHGSVVKYTCHTGRKIIGHDKLVCTNGRWSQVRFSCVQRSAMKRTPGNMWDNLSDEGLKEKCKAYCLV